MPTLKIILLLLSSAVLLVALLRTLRLPPLLAYFLVGLALGPHTFGWVEDSEAVRSLAEFGVVFLMFSIGLEFSLPQLYSMRSTVFGLGSAQVLVSMAYTVAASMLLGLDWRAALVIGGALTMSSTAIVSKMLVEQIELNSRHGRLSIGVLLFQDIAVVPLLILIPALATPGGDLPSLLGMSALKAGVVLAVLLVFGKSLINPWFELVARQRSQELFVLNVLMVTLGLAYATKFAGLSYALGAFVAGMLISETRYRYQVEADIGPFRDILLGLFFITLGMQLDLHALAGSLGWIALLAVSLALVKAGLVTSLCRAFGHEAGVALRTGLTLAQAGEFSFVLLAQGTEYNLLDPHYAQILLAAMLLSMLFAPFIIQSNGRIARILAPSYKRNRAQQAEDIAHVSQGLSGHAIICGYRRSGQNLARFLAQENIPYIALDLDPVRVREAVTAGLPVAYGDSSRLEILEAAGVARARVVVVSFSELRATLRVLHVVREHYPSIPIIVRTLDDTDMDRLREAGATEVVPEVLEGSLMLASHALVVLGVPLNRVVKRIRRFREEHYSMLRGFFHGLSDHDLDVADRFQMRLHPVQITTGAAAIGRRLADLALEKLEVQVQSIRRIGDGNIEPTPDTQLYDGDVVVLLGMWEGLASAENMLLKGK
ncbi:MAG TPA: monovalent cation:proton antiporter-2 (CPA2) family protein [Novimethylophilus sp.]|jgi:CPA2 family monovalent cation:H+ antiporter-2|uniref:monovalent cation:proton antiporter-2 (CPA2) family protein n=1 Tax=Novimethylophilus sp. TaxID=2137426 RepID=UPI002F42BB3B